MPGSYYLSCKVNFVLRVEDFLPLPPLPTGGPVPEGSPEAFGARFGDLPFPIVPYSCSIEKNSYRSADTARITVPFAKFPFDPRALRSAEVQIFGGALRADQYAGQMTPFSSNPQEIILDVEADATVNQLFHGLADDWRVKFDDGEPMVEISARDSSSIMIDAEIPPNQVTNIPKDLPLDQVIRLILRGTSGVPVQVLAERGLPIITGLAGASGFKIVNEFVDNKTGLLVTPLPGLGDFHAPTWFDSKRTSKKSRSAGAKVKISYWDYITDICSAAAVSVYVRAGKIPEAIPGGFGLAPPAPEIVLTNPSTYYQATPAPGFVPADERQFIYGLNVDAIEMTRNLSGKTVPTIEVRSFDTRNRVEIVERYPPLPKTSHARPSRAGDRVDIKVHRVDGLRGEGGRKVARLWAQSVYEQLGRGEFQVSIRTRHPSALPVNLAKANKEGGSLDLPAPDLFQLNPADPINVQINLDDVAQGQVSTVQAFNTMGLKRKQEFLMALGYPPNLAMQFAAAIETQQLQRKFRTQRVTYNWDYGRGWDFEIQAVNYLDVRNAVDATNPRAFQGPTSIEFP